MNKLPKGWNIYSWSDVLEVKNGKNQKAVLDENGNYPIYGSGGIMAYANDYLCDEGTTIIGRKGSINNPIYVESKFWNVDTAFGISPKSELDSKLLFYFCLGYDFTKHNKSTTLPSLTKSDLLKIQIPLPPLPEQKRIVSKLDALFERIDKSMALLEENITHTKSLMASALDEVFLEIDKKYWVELRTISDLITKGSSPNWQGVKYVDEPGVLFITSKNVGNHKLILGDKKTYLESKFNEIQPRSILQKDDILLNIVGASIGRTAKYDLEEVANINQAVCLIRLKKSLVNVNYALHFFNSTTCISYMFDKKVDNARANLSMGNIQKFLIPIPPLEQQNIISKKIGAILNNLELLQKEQQNKLNNLKALKESILDKAFKGEI